MSDQKFFSAAELAKRLSVSADLVRKLARDKKIPGTRVGSLYLFTDEDFAAIVKAGRFGPDTAEERK